MPYKTIAQLPKGVKNNLPKHAKRIYKEAYNSAWEQYDQDEERAHRVAWSAVKKAGYQKAPMAIGRSWTKVRLAASAGCARNWGRGTSR